VQFTRPRVVHIGRPWVVHIARPWPVQTTRPSLVQYSPDGDIKIAQSSRRVSVQPCLYFGRPSFQCKSARRLLRYLHSTRDVDLLLAHIDLKHREPQLPHLGQGSDRREETCVRPVLSFL